MIQIIFNDSFETKNFQEIWDKVADNYTSIVDDSDIEIANEINEILIGLGINENSTLLEAGCGSGHISGLLNNKGYNVDLLDLSNKAIEKAKEFFEVNKYIAKFYIGDLTNLSFLSSKYDIIWNSGVMEHFNDEMLLKALISIREQTKLYFVFLVPNPNSIPYLLFRYKLISEGKWIYGNEYLRTDYEEFLQKAGFNVISKKYLGFSTTKWQMDYVFSQETSNNAFKNLVDNNFISESNFYLCAYITSTDNVDYLNLKTSKNQFKVLSCEDYTFKFDALALIHGLHNNLKEKENEINSLNQAYKQKLDELENINQNLEKTSYSIKSELQCCIAQIESNKKEISELINNIQKENELNELRSNLLLQNARVIDLNRKIEEKESRNIQLLKELHAVYHSDFWKIANVYYKMVDKSKILRKVRNFFKQLRLRRKLYSLSINKTRYVNESNQIHKDNTPNLVKDIDNFKCIYKNSTQIDIILFSVIDWDFRYQRPQHIASSFAEAEHRVFYFDANFYHDELSITEVKENIKVIRLDKTSEPRIYDIDFDKHFEHSLIGIETLITRYNIRECTMIVEYPNWQPIAEYLKNKFSFKLVFDYIDDYTGFETNNKHLIDYSNKLAEISDLIVATSQFLYEKIEKIAKFSEIIRNGTEFNHFNKAANKCDVIENRTIIGYYGALAEWFDTEKIEYIAKYRPQWDIWLIGNITCNDIYELEKYSNIKLFGEKNYSELPELLKRFDTCLIPFKSNIDLIKATNPVKFYEYLSAGKKIVATEIPELMSFRDNYVLLTNDNEEFLKHIDSCINNIDPLVSFEERVEFAKTQDWRSRYHQFSHCLKVIHKKVSIIIVTYNNVEYTQMCIESILSKSAYPNYEIIIIDNASQDSTKDYLEDLELRYENIKVIINERNEGFAKANNIGIKIAQGEYIILLNNDTIVTRGWITGLIKHLNNSIGMVGPVTNSIGNEAMINVTYKEKAGIDDFAIDYTTKNFNKINEIPVLAMFCVAIKKELINLVGPLDERYKIGMFEDDDYSFAVRKSGYKIACAEDVFIHHFGKVSFKKLDDKIYQEIFETNKKLFEEKWNTIWVPHKYREGTIIN